MEPIGDVLIDEVGGEDHLSTPEVVAGPEQDPGKDEQVIQNEVGGHVGSSGHQGSILGEEMPDITQLGEEKEDPEDQADEHPALRLDSNK